MFPSTFFIVRIATGSKNCLNDSLVVYVGFVVSRRTICVHVYVYVYPRMCVCLRVLRASGNELYSRSINNTERDNRMHSTYGYEYTHAVDVDYNFQTLNAYYYLAVCFICSELLDCMLSRRRRRHTKQPLT